MAANLELKARDPDPQRSLDACERIGAVAVGVLTQQDTYFNVTRGRLKLRRERGRTPQLIAYERSDEAAQRMSRYRLIEVEEDRELEAALSTVLGVRAVVAKTRQLFLAEGVRIHLDHVEGLGTFIEFEALAADEHADLSGHRARLRKLRDAFQIKDADLVGESYSDLALAAGTPRSPTALSDQRKASSSRPD